MSDNYKEYASKEDLETLNSNITKSLPTVMTGATADAAGTSGLVPAPTKGNQDKFLKADGTWGTPVNTTYGVASTSANGLMSSADKTKLNNIADNANNYTHPTTSGNKHIPSGGSDGQILKWSADGTAEWGDAPSSSESYHIEASVWSGDGREISPKIEFNDSKYRTEYFSAIQDLFATYGYNITIGNQANPFKLISYSESNKQCAFSSFIIDSSDIANGVTPIRKLGVITCAEDSWNLFYIPIDDGSNKNGIRIQDQGNGYNYILYMLNGTLSSVCAASGLSIETKPTKLTYNIGDTVDLTGMVAQVMCEDNTMRDVTSRCTCEQKTITAANSGYLIINYYEGGKVFLTSISITINSAS